MKNEIIRGTIEDFLRAIPLSYDDISVIYDSDAAELRFKVLTRESGLLIGQNGEHFHAFNHLIRRIAGKKVGEETKFSVDVNDYRDRAVRELEMKAKLIAERAKNMKADVEMDPMSSYERMIVHSYLKNDAEIKTESSGEGRLRRVVIRYQAPTV